jgi:hypothetical protein
MNAKNSPYRQCLLMTAFGIVWISSIFIASALGQDFKRPDGSVPLPMDWSDRHVVYTVGSTGEQIEKMQADPRYFVATRLHGKELADEGDANGYPALRIRRPPGTEPSGVWKTRREPKTDWSVSLGTGGVAAGQYPAKFTYDVNATPDCTSDYAVFPVAASTTGKLRSHVTGTFADGGSPSAGQTVTLTVTPTGGSSVMLTLTSSLTVNTGLDFVVLTGGGHTNAVANATSLALAINRNLSATNAGRIAAIASSNTVIIYTITPGTGVTLAATTTFSSSDLSFGTVTAGSSIGSQANIVGLNNLYSGSAPPTPFCGTTYPTFIFSYSSGSGPVSTSPVISIDGTKTAYIENDKDLGAILHVLTFATGSTEYGGCNNNGIDAPTCSFNAVVPGITPSTATDFAIPLLSALATATTPTATAINSTRSSPFVNYSTDTLYVGDDNGNLYAFTTVFTGTPTVAGGKFPVTVSSGNFLNSPVVDVGGTGDILLGDSLSNTYLYSSAGALQGSKSIGNGTNGGIWDGAVVDSTNEVVYFTTNCSGSGGNSALSQIPFTSTSLGTVITSIDTNGEGCASGSEPQYGATPDNLYYTEGISSGSTATNGHILVSYQGTGSIRLAEWGFVSGALDTSRLFDTNSIYTGASVGSSPSTEFYSSSVAYTPTALTQGGTKVTVTTASNLFVTGQVVTIAGVAAGTGGCTAAPVAAINGQHIITVVSTTQFTFTSSVSATITSGSCTLTGSSATGPTQDFIFFGSGQPAVYTFTVPMNSSTQAPAATNTTSVTANGSAAATSGIIVDNYALDEQTSSIYFSTQATSKTQCGANEAYCAVKLTEPNLQ